jgi:hypothetical protein
MVLIPVVPEGVELSAQERTACVEDGQQPCFGPAHARLFGAPAHHGFAAGFHHAGANEESQAAKLAIAHAGLIILEVAQLGRPRIGSLRRAAVLSSYYNGDIAVIKS